MIHNISATRELIANIKSISSKKGKVTVLSQLFGRSEDDVKTFFKFCLDPSFTYGYSKLPEASFNAEQLPDFSIFSELNCVTENPKLGLKKRGIENLSNRATRDQRWALECIIKRKPDCGVGVKEIAKLWPGLLREQGYMGLKAESKDGIEKMFKAAEKKNVSVIWQEKYAGTHLIIEGTEDGIKAVSRQGEPVAVTSAMPLHIRELVGQAAAKDMYLVGEALILKEDGSGYEDEAVGNGMIRAGDIKNMEIRLFDLVPYDVVYGDVKPIEYLSRYRKLSNLIDNYTDVCINIKERPIFKIVNTSYVSSYTDAREFSDFVISKGGEGGVVLRGDGGWSNGKPSWRWKLKYEQEVDALITGVYPHKQKPWLIGGFECLVKGGSYDFDIKFKVGSGLTDKHREMEEDELIGETCTVRFTDISKAKNAKAYSLKNPRLEDVRPDRSPECTADVFLRYHAKTGRVHHLLTK